MYRKYNKATQTKLQVCCAAVQNLKMITLKPPTSTACTCDETFESFWTIVRTILHYNCAILLIYDRIFYHRCHRTPDPSLRRQPCLTCLRFFVGVVHWVSD